MTRKPARALSRHGGKRTGAGRPRRADSLTHTVAVVLTAELARQVDDAAERAGVTRAEWGRAAVRLGLERPVEVEELLKVPKGDGEK